MTNGGSSQSSYVPVAPFSASANSILCQDYIKSDQVEVASGTAGSPVAAFCNPQKGGAPEAFVITASGGGELAYLEQTSAAAHSTSQTGWMLVPLQDRFPDSGPYTATAVVSAAVSGGTTMWWSNGTYLVESSLRQDGFTKPNVYDGHPETDTVGLAYYVDPTNATEPQPFIFYVSTEPNTFVIVNSGLWTSIYEFAPPPGASLTLTMLSPTDWTLWGVSGGQVDYWTGTLGGSTPKSQTLGSQTGITVAAILDSYLGPAGASPLPIFVDSAQVPYLRTAQYDDQVLPTPSSVAGAWSVDSTPAGLKTIYVTDETDSLYLLRQLGWTNGQQLPLWAPPIPISPAKTGTASGNPGVATVYPDYFPSDPDTIFTSSPEGFLSVYSRAGGKWTGGPVLLPTWDAQTYEITSYRTQVNLVDANDVAVANYPLAVQTVPADVAAANSAYTGGPCGITVAGTSYLISGDLTASLTTTSAGTLTLSTLATDLAPPSLYISDPAAAPLLPEPLVVVPSLGVQAYMATPAPTDQSAGTPASTVGMLPYQSPTFQTFTADAMTGAQTSSGTPVFPGVQSVGGATPAMAPADAVTNVNNIMSLAPPATQPGPDRPAEAAAGAGAGAARPSTAGFILNRCNPSRPSYLEFDDIGAFHAELSLQRQGIIDFSLLGDIGDVFSDVWQGVKSAATAVAHVAVDFVSKVVSVAIWIDNEAVQIGTFVVEVVEDACNAILAVLSALEALVDDIIDFLRALFSFGNILDTQWAFTQAIDDAIGYAGDIVTWAQAEFAPSSSLVTDLTTRINDAFASLSGAPAAQTTIQEAGGSAWQPMGQPPSATVPLAGSGTALGGGPVTPASVSANPQASWLADQIAANAPVAPPSTPPADADSASAVSAAAAAFYGDFTAALVQSGVDFDAAVQDFLQACVALFNGSPDGFEDIVIPELLAAIEAFIDAILELVVGLVDGFLVLASAGLDGLESSLEGDLHGLLGFVQPIYKLLWDLAQLEGWDPPDGMSSTLTEASLAALLLAFPYTVIYELFTGSGPFPGGTIGGAGAGPDDEAVSEGHLAYLLVGPAGGAFIGMLQVIQDTFIVLAGATDVPAKGPLGFVTYVSAVWSAIEWVFAWPEGSGPASGISWYEVEEKTTALILAGGFAGAIANYCLVNEPETLEAGQAIWEEFSTSILSIVGVCELVFDVIGVIYAAVKGDVAIDDLVLEAVIGLLKPIPQCFSFLDSPAAQAATDDIPLAGAIKLALDLFVTTLAVPSLEITRILADDV